MSQDPATILEVKVKKRNGQIVNFNEIRIKKAIENAFKDKLNLPREVELPIEANRDIDRVFKCVLSVLSERKLSQEQLTVEEIQDEVIRQLFENGLREIAELYANYRKQHTQRRVLFELYSTIKRDGKVVSFKPEKITYAIAKSFRASNSGILTEELLNIAKEISEKVVDDIRATWTNGKSIHIEEIQDLVEKNLMKTGYHEVARRYIIYREQRARIRREEQHKQDPDTALEWVKQIVCKTPDGKNP